VRYEFGDPGAEHNDGIIATENSMLPEGDRPQAAKNLAFRPNRSPEVQYWSATKATGDEAM